MSSPSRKSLAHRAQSASSTGCLRLFFVPFFLVGFAMAFFLGIWPSLHVLAARSWEKTPCVIDSSQVTHSSGGKGTTYGFEIKYHYYRADHLYTSSRYSFVVGQTAGRSSKEAAVSRYPAGSETFCYVNAEAPEQAVIDRGMQGEFAFGLIGLVFGLPGALGLVFARHLTSSRMVESGELPQPMPGGDGPAVMKPAFTPMRKFLGLLIFSAIWNGFIGVFAYFVFFAPDAHQAPFFAKAVIGLLALVGAASVGGVVTNFLALFNPRVQLTAQTARVSLGGEFSFTWTVSGRAGMLRKLRIVLEGREEATYKRGTTTSTDTRVFAKIPVVDITEREFLMQGGGRVVVPSNLMHTFEGGRNKVLWRLKVSGEIPRWPDVADEYPIVVLPLPLAG